MTSQRSHHFIILTISIFFLFWNQALFGQGVFVSSTGESTGSGGSSTYTIGQMAYSSSTDAGGSTSEGIQQPYEISIITGIEEARFDLSISIFPNPTIDHLILKVFDYNNESIIYQLYDLSGKTIKSSKISSHTTFISSNDLSSSTYFLKIIDEQHTIRTFKIIKK